MSYKYSKGSQVIGDLKAADDQQRDTLIDFGEDQIEFQTSGSVRLQIANHHISSSLAISASALCFSDGVKIAGAPAGQDTVIDNQGNFFGDTIDVGTVSGSNIVITDSGSPVYQLPIADGNPDEVMSTDGSGQVQFRPVSELGTTSFLHYGYNPIFSGNTPIETTTVNGSTNDYGYRMPTSGRVTHITAEIQYYVNTGGNYQFKVEVYKNGIATSESGSVDISGTAGAANNSGFVSELNTPVEFDQGDRLTVKMNFDKTGIQGDDAALLLRVVTTG